MPERELQGYGTGSVTGRLDRKLVAVPERARFATIPEDNLICHCDGTADRVEACLASTQGPFVSTGNAKLDRFRMALRQGKEACAKDGLQRLGTLAEYIERE